MNPQTQTLLNSSHGEMGELLPTHNIDTNVGHNQVITVWNNRWGRVLINSPYSSETNDLLLHRIFPINKHEIDVNFISFINLYTI